MARTDAIRGAHRIPGESGGPGGLGARDLWRATVARHALLPLRVRALPTTPTNAPRGGEA